MGYENEIVTPVEAVLSHDAVFGAAVAGFPALGQALVDRALHEAAAETQRLSEEFRHLREGGIDFSCGNLPRGDRYLNLTTSKYSVELKADLRSTKQSDCKSSLCDGPQEGSEAESGERVAAVVGEMSEEVEEFVPQSSLAHQDEEHF